MAQKVSLTVEANGTRHNTKPMRRKEEVPDADDNRARKCKTLTTSNGEVKDTDNIERGSARH
jgi:hypothetical protein